MRLDAALPTPSRDWRARLPVFYGWVIVGGSLFALGLTYSVMYSFSVFYVALLEEFGWGRGIVAGVYSVFMIVAGAGALGAGALCDRFGPGRVIAAGGVLLAVGLLTSSRLTALWQLYLCYGVVAALGVSLAGWTASVTMINRWFSSRLGLALGIASGGIGVGIMVVVPLVQLLIETHGWRAAFVWLGMIAFAGLTPVGLLVLRGRPEDLGQGIDGTAAAEQRDDRVRCKRIEVVNAEWAARQWTVRSAARTAQCWMLIVVKVLGGVATQMIFVHQVVYLVDAGYDKLAAASIVGLIGFLSVSGKILWGWSADTIGREMTYTLGSCAMVAAVALLVLAALFPSTGMLYLYAVVFALGYAVSAPLWPLVAADLFAGRSFGAIYGFISVFNGFGSGLGAWLGGFVYDVTGSYTTAFGAAVVAKIVSAAALWIVAPRNVRRVIRL